MVVDLIGMIMTKQSHKYADKDDMHQVGWSWYIVVHHLQVAMCCLLCGCRQWYLVMGYGDMLAAGAGAAVASGVCLLMASPPLLQVR